MYCNAQNVRIKSQILEDHLKLERKFVYKLCSTVEAKLEPKISQLILSSREKFVAAGVTKDGFICNEIASSESNRKTSNLKIVKQLKIVKPWPNALDFSLHNARHAC